MHLASKDFRRIAYTFAVAFVGSLTVSIAQARNNPVIRAVVASVIVAAIAAGLSAVKNAALSEDHPLK